MDDAEGTVTSTAPTEDTVDTGYAAGAAPEMGAFGNASADDTSSDTDTVSEAATDVATHSGDMPSEDAQGDTGDMAGDLAVDTDTASAGDVGDVDEGVSASESGES